MIVEHFIPPASTLQGKICKVLPNDGQIPQAGKESPPRLASFSFNLLFSQPPSRSASFSFSLLLSQPPSHSTSFSCSLFPSFLLIQPPSCSTSSSLRLPLVQPPSHSTFILFSHLLSQPPSLSASFSFSLLLVQSVVVLHGDYRGHCPVKMSLAPLWPALS